MTIKKNQHRKDIARLSALAVVVVGGIQFAVPVQAQSEKSPSPAARRHYDERSNLASNARMVQRTRKVVSDYQTVRFVPERPMATEYLAKKIEIVRAGSTKASMTVEAAMYDHLAKFDQSMTEAKRWEDTFRSGTFSDQDQKINAKAFDAAVNRAGYAMNSYLTMLARVKGYVKDSFGDLASLVKLDDLKLANQDSSTFKQTLGDVFAKSDLRFTWPEGKGLYGGGETALYNELVNLQKALKSDDPATPSREPKTQLGLHLNQIREVEAKGLEAPMKALKVDVTNINPYSPTAKEMISSAKVKQPISSAIQAALKKAPRVPSGGPVALVVGAAGFAASSAVMAGEAETVDTTAADTSTEFNRGWVRSGRPTSR